MSLSTPPLEPIRVSLGQIACTDNLVYTPVGTHPLAGTIWTTTNQTMVTESIPGYAIVLTILGVWFCLLGLLFLLIKERRLTGSVQVSVQGPGFSYSTYLPVNSELAIYQISTNVDWIRAHVAQLPRT
jgi:hypothetical protein